MKHEVQFRIITGLAVLVLSGGLILAEMVVSDNEGLENLNWIWSKENSSPLVSATPGKRFFRMQFELPADVSVKQARIQIAVDNSCDIYINGGYCGSVNDWSVVSVLGLKKHLKSGHNVIAIEATNVGSDPSPAGLIGRIFLTFENNVLPRIIPFDESCRVSKEAVPGWKNIDFDDNAWEKADIIAQMGALPWGAIGSSKNKVPELFPHFIVPNFDHPMEMLREMFFLHYGAGGGGTLWDGWMPMATLWPATSNLSEHGSMRRTWRAILSARRIDAEGYVSCHQHKGLAHSEGWPFPLWMQAGGVGWQFSLSGLPYGIEFGVVKTVNDDGWRMEGAKTDHIGADGWKILLQQPKAMITTPTFEVDSFVAPFIRLEWSSSGLGTFSSPYMEWATKEDPNFSSQRRIYFSPVPESENATYTMIATYRLPLWKGKIVRLRFNFDNASPSSVNIKTLITAVDSRHTINNATYLQGCDDYINLTGDLAFLRENIQKMRLALRYAIREFGIDKNKLVVTPWVGHDGRSGVERSADGTKTVHLGRGIGNNYWDLLPFAGKDALATIYYYDAINRMSMLERNIREHPQWAIPTSPIQFDPDELGRLAAAIKDYAGKLFWNSQTGRFVAAIDRDGRAYDYGFTMVNCEAIYYGFTTAEQSQSIVEWISGKRLVKGDTSQGEDIYHWRFAPRATTVRNLDYYAFVWSLPENIPWGDQIQDGGAVLGFSYHDIMARLKINGSDDAWQRLCAIIEWFDDVQAAGGYRDYYNIPGRGVLQGGGPPGGLGVDKEFTESVLVPQTILYGFMGFHPSMDGFSIQPRLPRGWPSLTITRINIHDVIMDITVAEKKIEIITDGLSEMPLFVFPPQGKWKVTYLDDGGKKTGESVTMGIENPTQGISLNSGKHHSLILEQNND